MGAWVNFITEANDFSKVFPGIRLRVCTLETNFKFPFYRELLLSLGLVSVSRKSCLWILGKDHGANGPNACLIVVGGASEALLARPRTNDLIIKRRLGFIKMALITGASLVPVMSFGENDLFDQIPNPPGSAILQVQTRLKQLMSFSLPLFHGRGVFTYNYGLMPFRAKITSVVGNPIETRQNKNPTLEDLLFLQKKYMDELERIYFAYRNEYETAGSTPLRFVE